MENIFQTLEAIFPYKGGGLTKVVNTNIITFIKTKIFRHVLSVKKHPLKMPLDHSGMNIINQFTSCLEQQQCHKRSKTSRSVKRDDEGTRAFVCVCLWGGGGMMGMC